MRWFFSGGLAVLADSSPNILAIPSHRRRALHQGGNEEAEDNSQALQGQSLNQTFTESPHLTLILSANPNWL